MGGEKLERHGMRVVGGVPAPQHPRALSGDRRGEREDAAEGEEDAAVDRGSRELPRFSRSAFHRSNGSSRYPRTPITITVPTDVVTVIASTPSISPIRRTHCQTFAANPMPTRA